MRKNILYISILTACTFLSASPAEAQDRLDFNQSLITGTSHEAHVESNFSLSGTVIGLEAGYEQHLGRKTSLTLRGGYHSAVVAGEILVDGQDPYYSKPPYGSHANTQINRTKLYYASRPGISLEGRYYTSMDRRARMGKRTDLNSANFVAFRAGSYLLPRNRDNVDFDLKAMYGIRRVYGRHFFIEPVFGIGYNFYVNEGYPIINARLGFSF